MKLKTVTVLDPGKEQLIPCQLGKLSNRPCTLICAFDHGCPVPYLDSHDMLLVRPVNKLDLEPRD